MNQIDLCKKIAYEAHEGQFRRDGVTPYIEHPKRVVEILGASEMSNDTMICVAWLHDVIEDCNMTKERLRELGVSNIALRILSFLTKKEGVGYESYIKKIYSGSYWARRIKIADIVSNLTDNPTEKQVVKYTKALMMLGG